MKPDFSFKLTKKVEKYIKDNNMIGHGDSVIVGLSGGADSVCLFLLLNKIKEAFGFNLYAVHVNHGIRGESAFNDEQFSKTLCEKFDIPFMSYNVDVPEIAKQDGLTVEEAGRNARYTCFANYASEISNASHSNIKIAVAHHMDDQAETVIFNMIRGSGLKGMGGMEPINERKLRSNNNEFTLSIIRPLLCINRAEIEKYLDFVSQEYCTDETNAHNDYSRNQVRNIVIPALNDIQPKTSEHIALMAQEIREAQEYIDYVVYALYERAVIKREESNNTYAYCIDVNMLKAEKTLIAKQLIIYVLRQMIETYKNITRTHIDDVYSLLLKGKGKEIALPYSLTAIREKEYIVIFKNK